MYLVSLRCSISFLRIWLKKLNLDLDKKYVRCDRLGWGCSRKIVVVAALRTFHKARNLTNKKIHKIIHLQTKFRYQLERHVLFSVFCLVCGVFNSLSSLPEGGREDGRRRREVTINVLSSLHPCSALPAALGPEYRKSMTEIHTGNKTTSSCGN